MAAKKLDDLETDLLAAFNVARRQARNTRNTNTKQATKFLIVKFVIDGDFEEVWINNLNLNEGRGSSIVRARNVRTK
jgi:hypothetical protein